MRITRVGEIDWASGVVFDLHEYLRQLEALEASHWDESYDRAYTPGGERFANHALAAKRLRERGLLRLPALIRLDQSLQVTEVPIKHTFDHGFAGGAGTFQWEVRPQGYDYPRPGQVVHPVLYALKEWATYTGQELAVTLEMQDKKTMRVEFFSTRSIARPTRYLSANARRLKNWAASAPVR